ncbi:MAG: hypothetical protein JW914_02245 [Syntrophaceae bacterium]|nr:hypothetical protein [Syntrophaceae bacterium]
MNKTDKNLQKGSNSKILIILSILLILVGGMITDPFAGLVCFTLAGIFSLTAVFTMKGWGRYIALGLLVIIVLLAINEFPQARDHYQNYRHKNLSGNEK